MLSSVLVTAVGATGAGRARAQDLPARVLPIVERVRSGDLVDALARLRALDAAVRREPALAYLEGRLAEAASEPGAAADAYARVTSLVPASIVRDASERRARALVHAGRCEEADAVFAALAPRSASLRALQAECAVARGALDEAGVVLARLAQEDPADVDTFALWWTLAEAHARRGRRDDALAVLRSALIARCDHPDAARAEAAFASLAGAPPSWSAEERRARAARYTAVLDHARARLELDAIPEPAEPRARQRWLRARGQALFRTRHAYAEAARILSESAALGGPEAPEDVFLAARASSRAGDDAAAIRGYRRVTRSSASPARRAEAEYLAAWLELRAGGRDAGRAMARFVAGRAAVRVPASAREGRFQLGLDAFRRGQFARAGAWFEASSVGSSDPLHARRGAYWSARARAGQGDRDAALAGYRAVLRMSTLDWYALLAHDRLAELGASPGSPFAGPPPPEVPAAPAVALPEAVRLLSALGLDRDASAALRGSEGVLRAQGGLRALVGAWASVGDAGRTFRLVAGHDALERPALGDGRWVWAAAYPRPFETAVVSAATSQGLTPSLLWAVMRQESAYDPDALSGADAMGLLQMLPSTGARIAGRLGVTFHRDMLFDPAWNTRLAAAYLRALVDAHGVPLAFAAYNAGEHRVEAWLARSGEIALDLFVEEIPFDQTRGYVRRVTSHLAHYLHQAEPSEGWPALALPRMVAPRAGGRP